MARSQFSLPSLKIRRRDDGSGRAATSPRIPFSTFKRSATSSATFAPGTRQVLHAKNASLRPGPVSLWSSCVIRNCPSIVPVASEDRYIVVNHYGGHGVAVAETDLNLANCEATISDLMSGQHSDPPRDHIQYGDQPLRRCFARRRAGDPATSGPKGAMCRPSWKTSLIAMLVKTVS